MAYIKFQDIIDRLGDNGVKVFRINEIARLMNKSRSYISLLLSNNKNLNRIERGKYYVKGADIYEIASNVITPSYVSLFSALRYYDVTTQMPIKISVISTKRHTGINIEGYKLEFITLDRTRFFGYSKMGNVYIATLEKAFLDALYLNVIVYNELSESFGYALKNGQIKIELLKRYAGDMNSAALISRLGMIMEEFELDTHDLYASRSKRKVKMLGYRNSKNRWNVS